MQLKILIALFLISSTIFGQEIGNVKNGIHSIKILKCDNLFSCVYSDVNSNFQNSLNSFLFLDKSSLYSLLIDGFESEKAHQLIVQMIQNTIVKFKFATIKGKKMLKIMQNNLDSKTFGTSTYFSKKDIGKLFGNP